MLSTLAECAEIADRNSNSHASRIVGGTEVIPHSYPFMVALIVSFGGVQLLCQGCIVSNMMILTTGKCIDNSDSVQVIAGAHDMTRVEPDQRRQIVYPPQYRIHPNYTANWFDNDIALLWVDFPFVPSQSIQIVALPDLTEEDQFAGLTATIFGLCF